MVCKEKQNLWKTNEKTIDFFLGTMCFIDKMGHNSHYNFW